MEFRLVNAENTYSLRQKILRPHQPLSACQYAGDDKGFHFAAIQDGKILSVVSFAPEDKAEFAEKNQYRIRGMATDDSVQGKGVGSGLLLAALAHARELGIRFVWCNAREKAIPFYERHGFQCVGDLFEIEGIGPHKVMFRRC
jgi:GNAT superfamily N-acetyltransferase